MTDPTSPSRPRVVDLAFWCFVGGAVIMIVGGLMASTAAFDAERLQIANADAFLSIVRGTGIGAVLVGGALAFLAGRARRGDGRFYRATLALAAAAIVVIVIIAGLIGAVHLVIAAYDAPFPDERYKAGARQFPMLVPVSPDDPAAPANRAAWAALVGLVLAGASAPYGNQPGAPHAFLAAVVATVGVLLLARMTGRHWTAAAAIVTDGSCRTGSTKSGAGRLISAEGSTSRSASPERITP